MRAEPVLVSEVDRALLQSWLRTPSMPAGLATRARIVFWASEGVSMTQIADRLSISRPTVTLWCRRFRELGPDGLTDPQRSGRQSISHPRHAHTARSSVDPD